LKRLEAAVKLQQSRKEKQTKPGEIKAWLETQDAYTMHRPIRKHFPRNPYTVNNVNEVWELNLMDLQNLAKYNDKFKFLLR
jgi:hypothetical protein